MSKPPPISKNVWRIRAQNTSQRFIDFGVARLVSTKTTATSERVSHSTPASAIIFIEASRLRTCPILIQCMYRKTSVAASVRPRVRCAIQASVVSDHVKMSPATVSKCWSKSKPSSLLSMNIAVAILSRAFKVGDRNIEAIFNSRVIQIYLRVSWLRFTFRMMRSFELRQ